MKRLRVRLALLAAAPVLALFAVAGTADASPGISLTAPSGNYGISSSETSTTVTITSNPSNDNVRVKLVCLGGTKYSGWHNGGSFGTSCTTKIAGAYVQYPEANPGTHEYWIPGDKFSGTW